MTELHGLPWVLLAGLAGLLTGSFLNLVAYRMPLMMQALWERDVKAWQAEQAGKSPVLSTTPPALSMNLAWPASHCTHCKTPLKWWHNIPVLSYLMLRGQCGFCKAPIGVQYPLVEMVTAGLFMGIAAQHPPGAWALAWAVFAAALWVLAVIDFHTYLLPDDITLPLMWLGLVVHALLSPEVLASRLWGAVLGYGSLWSLFHLYRWIRKKEGMGYGDFKLLAALGAWFGVHSLLPIVLVASLSGAVVGIAGMLIQRKGTEHPIPFGPWLALGGVLWLFGGLQKAMALLG